jgi:hypothetical protein
VLLLLCGFHTSSLFFLNLLSPVSNNKG